MEDIMIIRSSFMRRIISQIINKALKKQMPGVEVELKDIQANWLEKEQKAHVHLESWPANLFHPGSAPAD